MHKNYRFLRLPLDKNNNKFARAHIYVCVKSLSTSSRKMRICREFIAASRVCEGDTGLVSAFMPRNYRFLNLFTICVLFVSIPSCQSHVSHRQIDIDRGAFSAACEHQNNLMATAKCQRSAHSGCEAKHRSTTTTTTTYVVAVANAAHRQPSGHRIPITRN